MKKTKQIVALLLAGAMFLAGCGKTETSSGGNTPAISGSSENIGNNEENGNELPGNGSDDELEDTPQAPETPEPTAGVITPEQGYNDTEREVSIVGLKEYKKIKTDKYTDAASKGKKFLVLFLKIRNRTNEKVYFNVNYLTAEIDGKEIENTVLFNEPEGYPTVFSNIAPDSYYGGFIVWEIPKDWKKIKITYAGWRDSHGLTLNSTLTKKDLKEPEKYSIYTYGQNSSGI